MKQNYGSGDIIKKKDKQSCHSCMRHSALICFIILPSIIIIFPMVPELWPGNKNDVNYGSGDIIIK